MTIREVIRTSGDIRRFIAQTMVDIRSGDLSTDKGACIAQLAKEITASMQAEVNVAKVRMGMLSVGKNMGEVTQMGKLVIEDEGTVPTLSGASTTGSASAS